MLNKFEIKLIKQQTGIQIIKQRDKVLTFNSVSLIEFKYMGEIYYHQEGFKPGSKTEIQKVLNNLKNASKEKIKQGKAIYGNGDLSYVMEVIMSRIIISKGWEFFNEKMTNEKIKELQRKLKSYIKKYIKEELAKKSGHVTVQMVCDYSAKNFEFDLNGITE